MTLMQRRRALIAKKENNILFDWDYTEGTDSVVLSGGGTAVMQSDGLYLSGSTTAWSLKSISPNITPLTGSYKITITYKNLVSSSSNSSVKFYLFNSEYPGVNILRQKTSTASSAPNITRINDGSVAITAPWNLTDSGSLIIEYNDTNHTVKFTQGQNEASVQVVTSTGTPRIATAQTGTTANKIASITIQHIKIERV